MKNLLLLCLGQLLLISSAFSQVKVAIIDSGVDYQHRRLQDHISYNKKERVDRYDNDHNGLVDDYKGWNFAFNNNQSFYPQHMKNFTANVYSFFKLLALAESGKASKEQVDMINKMRNNEEYMAQVDAYGNYSHGSHVAGIVTKMNPNIEILDVALLGTFAPDSGGEAVSSHVGFHTRKYSRMNILTSQNTAPRKTKAKGSKQQFMEMLQGEAIKTGEATLKISRYMISEKVAVANGSYGQSLNFLAQAISQAHYQFLGYAPKNKELFKLVRFYMQQAVNYTKKMAQMASGTLFVFAAGNDTMDTDKIPNSPAGINQINSISVAATLGRQSLAGFSNYGAHSVDVAAPGVGIYSSVPLGNRYMPMSGTSQATPYVTGVASLVKEKNPKLTPWKMKQIILGTVDKKAFLINKVRTAGIVNPKRAVYAAELSRDMPLDEAIARARNTISDI